LLVVDGFAGAEPGVTAAGDTDGAFVVHLACAEVALRAAVLGLAGVQAERAFLALDVAVAVVGAPVVVVNAASGFAVAAQVDLSELVHRFIPRAYSGTRLPRLFLVLPRLSRGPLPRLLVCPL